MLLYLSWSEERPYKPNVGGSNPSSSTKRCTLYNHKNVLCTD